MLTVMCQTYIIGLLGFVPNKHTKWTPWSRWLHVTLCFANFVDRLVLNVGLYHTTFGMGKRAVYFVSGVRFYITNDCGGRYGTNRTINPRRKLGDWAVIASARLESKSGIANKSFQRWTRDIVVRKPAPNGHLSMMTLQMQWQKGKDLMMRWANSPHKNIKLSFPFQTPRSTTNQRPSLK